MVKLLAPLRGVSLIMICLMPPLVVKRIDHKLLARLRGYTLVLISSLGSAAGIILLLLAPGTMAAIIVVVIVEFSSYWRDDLTVGSRPISRRIWTATGARHTSH